MGDHQQQSYIYIYSPFPHFYNFGAMGTPPPPSPPPPLIYSYHFNSNILVYGGSLQVTTPFVPQRPVPVFLSPTAEHRENPRVLETGSSSASKRENKGKEPCEEVEFRRGKPDPQIDPDGTKTTLMIRNIPNKYNRTLLLELLDEHCKRENEKENPKKEVSSISAYDFLYLPIDFRTKCNKGYAFVNFTNPKAAWRFYLSKNNKTWELFRSKKITDIAYAKIQGKDELMKRFQNTIFACDSEEFLPVSFEPHRDGTCMSWMTEINVGILQSSEGVALSSPNEERSCWKTSSKEQS